MSSVGPQSVHHWKNHWGRGGRNWKSWKRTNHLSSNITFKKLKYYVMPWYSHDMKIVLMSKEFEKLWNAMVRWRLAYSLSVFNGFFFLIFFNVLIILAFLQPNLFHVIGPPIINSWLRPWWRRNRYFWGWKRHLKQSDCMSLKGEKKRKRKPLKEIW